MTQSGAISVIAHLSVIDTEVDVQKSPPSVYENKVITMTKGVGQVLLDMLCQRCVAPFSGDGYMEVSPGTSNEMFTRTFQHTKKRGFLATLRRL